MKTDPEFKINIWKILKEMVGKDITKFAVPGMIEYFILIKVELNEPLSMT